VFLARRGENQIRGKEGERRYVGVVLRFTTKKKEETDAFL